MLVGNEGMFPSNCYGEYIFVYVYIYIRTYIYIYIDIHMSVYVQCSRDAFLYSRVWRGIQPAKASQNAGLLLTLAGMIFRDSGPMENLG